MRLRLTRTERQRLKKRHTADPRAYEAYMRGLFHLAKRTTEGFSRAIEYFERAISEDVTTRSPTLVWRTRIRWWVPLRTSNRRPNRSRARSRPRSAEELDPLSLIIGTAHGRLLTFADRYRDSVERLRHTLEVDSSFQQAHFDLGIAYAELGRWDEAVAEIEPLLEAADRRTVMLAVFRQHLRAERTRGAPKPSFQNCRSEVRQTARRSWPSDTCWSVSASSTKRWPASSAPQRNAPG